MLQKEHQHNLIKMVQGYSEHHTHIHRHTNTQTHTHNMNECVWKTEMCTHSNKEAAGALVLIASDTAVKSNLTWVTAQQFTEISQGEKPAKDMERDRKKGRMGRRGRTWHRDCYVIWPHW